MLESGHAAFARGHSTDSTPKLPTIIDTNANHQELPEDTVGLIIEALLEESDPAGAAPHPAWSPYMLVCKSFYYPFRRLAFARTTVPIYLYTPISSTAPINSFCDIVTKNPGLLLDIRQFELAICHPGSGYAAHWESIPLQAAGKELERLAELLTRSQIQSLTIQYYSSFGGFGGSYALTGGIASGLSVGKGVQALTNLRCCLRSLCSLTLVDVAFPPRALIVGDPHSDAPEHLALIGVGFSNPLSPFKRQSATDFPRPSVTPSLYHGIELARTSTAPIFPALKTLQIGGKRSRSFVQFLLTAERETPLDKVVFTMLKELTLGPTEEMAEAVRDGRLAVPRLTTLSVPQQVYRYGISAVSTRDDHPLHTNLRVLEVVYDVEIAWPNEDPIISFLFLPPTLRILRIVCHYKVSTERTFEGKVLAFLDCNWTYIDNLLSELVFLEEVTIRLIIREARNLRNDITDQQNQLHKRYRARFDARAEKTFPKLFGSGKLRRFSWEDVEFVQD